MVVTTADVAYELARAYLSKHDLPPDQVPKLLLDIHAAVLEVDATAEFLPRAESAEQAAAEFLVVAKADAAELGGSRKLPGAREALREPPTMLAQFADGPVPEWPEWLLEDLRKDIRKQLGKLTKDSDPANWPDWCKRTILADGSILCLEDGKGMGKPEKYLSTTYGLTFAEYQSRWRLPVGYPAKKHSREQLREPPTMLAQFADGPVPAWPQWLLDVLRSHVTKKQGVLTPENDPVNWSDWVKRTIPADGLNILCLEDGEPKRMLVRFLSDTFGIGFDKYLARWGLPAGYPSNCPETMKWHQNPLKYGGPKKAKGKAEAS